MFISIFISISMFDVISMFISICWFRVVFFSKNNINHDREIKSWWCQRQSAITMSMHPFTILRWSSFKSPRLCICCSTP